MSSGAQRRWASVEEWAKTLFTITFCILGVITATAMGVLLICFFLAMFYGWFWLAFWLAANLGWEWYTIPTWILFVLGSMVVVGLIAALES